MAIPKILYQTYKTYERIPLFVKSAMLLQRVHCLGWRFEFYDDERIAEFLKSEYGGEVFSAYDKLAIGAAKADFFRYAVLYKYGGVYLDVDSEISANLGRLIRPDDVAIIAHEGNPDWYVQWALVYAPGHPFLARTIDKMVANIESNLFPHDSHAMTGPRAYTEAINECRAADPAVPYREVEVDYGQFFRFKRRYSRVLYKDQPHWRDELANGVLKK
ncbi:MAG TPA: glycosyltransferase [Rectinemataceae bacterium]|nr:glycosyltransferase [Rectinemataceae bacterium]